MRGVQTFSAVTFILLVNIPLIRVHSAWLFVTAGLSSLLNLKTKYWIYESANKLIVRIFAKDKEAINHVQKSRDLFYESELESTNIDSSCS
jgi:hypothetical protein